ncbi:MAG: hypothetical protein EOO77_20380 [Oxalobacteraceae bacterium]|nr:MAG: hypothetical protein EOO77_20380 [Oxalobacteraceae bacterium]
MRNVSKMPNYDRLIANEQLAVEGPTGHKLTGDASEEPLHSWERVGTLAHAKRSAIILALQDCDYNVAATAAKLEIGRSTIYRLFEEYRIEPSVRKASVVLEDGGPICHVVVDQPPNVRSRLLFEDGKLKLIELAVRN